MKSDKTTAILFPHLSLNEMQSGHANLNQAPQRYGPLKEGCVVNRSVGMKR